MKKLLNIFRPEGIHPILEFALRIFFGKKKGRQSASKKTMIEVKPKNQTVPPSVPKKKTVRFIQELATWAVNDAKWTAARSFCESNGWDFTILTEDDLNLFRRR